MEAYLIKNGKKHRLGWEAGRGPVVRMAIEENDLFSFKAPYVTMSIDDPNEAGYQTGGTLNVERGDTIVIKAGSPGNEVEVFRGTVDRDVRWNPQTGDWEFNAVGTASELKDINLGFGLKDSDGLKTETYRYVKQVGEVDEDSLEETQWEYRAFSEAYENQFSRSDKVGYRREHIFETRGLDTEAKNATIFEYVSYGLYRRRLNEAGLRHESFQSIIDAVEKTLNFNQNVEWSFNFSPGQIPGTIDVVIADVSYDLIHIFKQRINNIDRYFYIGWNDDDEAGLYELVNITQSAKILGMNFDNTLETLYQLQQQYYNSINGIREGHIYHEFVWGQVSGSRAIFYEIWSWLAQGINYDDAFPGNPYPGYRGTMVEWYDVDLDTGGVINHINHHKWERVIAPQEFREVDTSMLNRSAAIAFDQVDIPVFSTSIDRVPVRSLNSPFGRYYADGKVLAFTGPRGLQEITFDLRDATAAELLVEICKLTNSVMYVTFENELKVINIVSRDTLRQEYRIPFQYMLAGFSYQVSSYYGQRTPQINSSIVINDHHLAALRDYYADYFPLEEERFELVLEEVTDVAQIGLGDGIRFKQIGLGQDVTPARVSEIEIREGEIKMVAVRLKS